MIEELRDHLLADKEKWGIILTGESGSGKSAVFSMMYKTMIREDCLLLAHSAGISPTAKSVAELLKKWNRQLKEYLGCIEEELEPEQGIRGIEEQRIPGEESQKLSQKTGLEKFQEQFSELLPDIGKKRVVLLIDALDGLSPHRGPNMTWLPQTPLTMSD
jgi:hypothetical protein